jgi:phage tail sheath gpL-like
LSNITDNSLAAGVGSSVKNKTFKFAAQVVQRKILLVGTGDPLTEAGNLLNEPILVTSPEDVAAKTGFGWMLHRLAIASFKGSKGIETWVVQQAETGAQAAGELDFTGSIGVQAGTLAIYIANERVAVNITAGMTIEEIADAVVAAITANPDLPVTAVKVAVTFEVTITSKSTGPWGDDISLNFNLQSDDETPTGIVTAITGMTGGTGIPDIQTALDSLGTGDGANEAFFTDAPSHGYGQDTTTLDAVANYVGQGNDFTGLYDKVVHKPFRSLVGDVAAGSGGLSALVALGNGRKNDRANGVVAVPGSASHPAEIAAQALGVMAKINNNIAEGSYLDQVLEGVHPGDKADRWTSEYNNRDTAVKAGVSPTVIKNGAVVMQNVVTFYHPDSVPQTSNGYRSQRNISILQNILYNVALNFEGEKWQGISIVADVTRVGAFESRKKARDTDSVLDDLVALARSFESNAWIFSASFTIDELKNPGSVVIRGGGDGFNNTLKVVLSGEGLILDTVTEFDTSIAVFL